MQGSHSSDSPTDVESGRLKPARPRRRYAWFLLLLPCYIAYLVPGIFARQEPAIQGVPFFYWWQFCWIILTALLTGAVYLLAIRDRGSNA